MNPYRATKVVHATTEYHLPTKAEAEDLARAYGAHLTTYGVYDNTAAAFIVFTFPEYATTVTWGVEDDGVMSEFQIENASYTFDRDLVNAEAVAAFSDELTRSVALFNEFSTLLTLAST